MTEAYRTEQLANAEAKEAEARGDYHASLDESGKVLPDKRGEWWNACERIEFWGNKVEFLTAIGVQEEAA